MIVDKLLGVQILLRVYEPQNVVDFTLTENIKKFVACITTH